MHGMHGMHGSLTTHAHLQGFLNMDDRAVRMVKSEPKFLSANSLLEEFQRLALTGRAEVWNLASHNIQPRLLRDLFELIRLSDMQLSTPIAVDLDDNRLNCATVDDFKVRSLLFCARSVLPENITSYILRQY
jgi:hypothetical protein